MLKKILRYSFDITEKQVICLIFILTCFLGVVSFTVLQHNGFYSYLNEDVACIVDMSKSFETEYELINKLNLHNWSEAINLLKTYWKPPAFFIFSAPILLSIYDINIFLSILNSLLCFITLLSVYGIVKGIHSKNAGLFACFILSFCPLFFVMHRTFFIETMLMSSICVVIYIITKNKFDTIYWNILFTIALTIALLTKEQIFIFYPIFLLFIIVNKENYTNIKRLLTIILSFLCSYLFAYFLWYKYNAPNIFQHLLNYAKDTINTDYFYYIKSFYFFDLSPFIFILLAISIIYFLFKKQYIHIIVSFLFVLFVFSLSDNKVSRHIFPIIIFCPILISLFVFQIKNSSIKKSIICIITLVLFAQFASVNFLTIKNFISGKFYGYNYFKGVTYYNYKSNTETYKQQLEYLKTILGNNFEEETAFINFFPTQAYNFLIFQKGRENKTCNLFIYQDLNNLKKKIELYKNIVISSSSQETFNEFTNWLLLNKFKYVDAINIFNHTQAKTFLYKKDLE